MVVGDTTIYRSQLKNRAESPAHRLSFGLPLAASIPIADVQAPPRLVLRASTPLHQAADELIREDLPGAPVVNANGAFIGSVHLPTLINRPELSDGDPRTPVGRLADANALTVAADANLDAALEALAVSRGDWVPVLDSTNQVVGIIGTSDLVRGYQLALQASIRRLGRASKASQLLELRLTERSPALGKQVQQLGLPPHTVIVAVLRAGSLLFADAQTKLQLGDTVSVLTRTGEAEAVMQRLDQPDDGAPAGDAAVDTLA
ncbi:MAG: CBS domain-containing protein [Mycobacteriales bacterium]